MNEPKPNPENVHVMPNDGKHEAFERCHCRPVEDEQTRRAIAAGQQSACSFTIN